MLSKYVGFLLILGKSTMQTTDFTQAVATKYQTQSISSHLSSMLFCLLPVILTNNKLTCRSRRPVNVVDVTSCSGRSLPLTRPPATTHHNQQRGKGHRNSTELTGTSTKLPWSLGFAEAIGRDSRQVVPIIFQLSIFNFM